MANLEKMVVDKDVCLIMTAHVNDNGQTRDSRMIEKAASIRIELDRDHMSPDPILRNTTKMSISKNRPFSNTGLAAVLRFNPDTFALEEVTDAQFTNDEVTSEDRIVEERISASAESTIKDEDDW